MSDLENYQMVLDMFRCHLGLSEDEAKVQLGLAEKSDNTSFLTTAELAELEK